MNKKMKEFFNGKADGWDENGKKKKSTTDIVAKLSGVSEDSRVLDIACGTGVMFTELLKYNVKEIVGVDISEKMIEIASEKYKEEKKVKVVCKDLLEFDEGKFDQAIIYNAYPHFKNKEDFINKLYNLLNEKGRFIIAHGSGREQINGCHKNMSKELYLELLPISEEIYRFRPYFKIDIMIDTPELYIISGLKKVK